MSSIGERIKQLRIRAGLTQQQLAEMVGGTSASAIGMYEQGRRSPDMERIVKLCEIFSVSTDYLLGVDEHNVDASKIIEELRIKASQSNCLTLNGAVMNDESRERLLKAIEFISSVILPDGETTKDKEQIE